MSTPYTYNNLVAAKSTVGSLKQWINRGDLPSEAILYEAQQIIYNKLRIRDMIAVRDPISLSQGDQTATLPAGYIHHISLCFTGAQQGRVRHRLEIGVEEAAAFDTTGARVQMKPRYWYADGSDIRFDSPADQAYTLRLVYFGRPTALGTENQTNYLTDHAPRLLRSACLMIANEWMKDDGERDRWMAIMEDEIDTHNAIYGEQLNRDNQEPVETLG